MSDVKIFWDPQGFELDSLGKNKYLRATDGDTPYISVSIRMLSIDTPEVHYPGNSKPSKQDDNLKQLADWIDQGKTHISDDLRQYLIPKLESGQAGTLQEEQGVKATEELEKLLDEKLTKPNGKKRSVFVRAADEHFDQYGRLLAYMSPSFTSNELSTMTLEERSTFNLLMIKSGWAATFPIYPSIPKYDDLILLQKVAKNAYENNLGAWSDNKTLTGYEFRMCVRLHGITSNILSDKSTKKDSWVTRYCVDMTTREIFSPQDYHKVEPHNRIFIWPKDVSNAVGKMNLLPAGSI
jgi:endonuclease YncB( thermonuclease family)